MSFTYGFFNSVNHDRLYDADQMSRIFDGLIHDGIYSTIGTCMVVQASTGMTVNVGIGRAHFNHRWMFNDAIMPLTCQDSSQVLSRYDAVVIEVDESAAVRECAIKIVMGTESVSPEYPTMIDTEYKHQYPLAYIYIAANATQINQADITNKVGTDACPFVTSLLQHLSIEELLIQWENQWELWSAGKREEIEAWQEQQESDFKDWEDTAQQGFLDWVEHLADELDSNQAAHLQRQIDEIIPITDEEVDELFED